MNKKLNRALLFSAVITFALKVVDYFSWEYLINSKLLVSNSTKSYILIDLISFIGSIASPVTHYISLFIDMNANVFFSFFNVLDFAFWTAIIFFVLIHKKGTAVGIPLLGVLFLMLGNHFISVNATMYFTGKSLMNSPSPNWAVFIMLLVAGIILICCGFGLVLWAKWGRGLSLLASAILAILDVFIIASVHGGIERQGVNNVQPKIMGIYYLTLISLFLIAGFVYYLTRPKVKGQFR
ncbi:MAG: hypothetical protein A3C36_02435 [Omnitrophica WOR_2 bacterium RIFCSPHIGHO2_02_FULL_52_10]|nr:MAG: hypothetical protein A3C36_02435 [Omnitrophica WOR_2 bacterium RIFCSPHIGHO2_02_FULL_52_10]